MYRTENLEISEPALNDPRSIVPMKGQSFISVNCLAREAGFINSTEKYL